MAPITRLSVVSRLPLFPALFSAVFVLSVFTDSSLTVQVIPRPLAVAVVIAFAIQAMFALAIANWHRGSLYALLPLLMAAGYETLAIAVAVLLIVLFLAQRAKRFGPAAWAQISQALNAAMATMLVISIGMVVVTALAQPHFEPRPRGSGSGPDVYLILLDGYPRSDTLAEDFGHDNEPFLATMQRLGFDVARHARSNYNLTALTLASMLNMRHVADLASLRSPPTAPAAQYRALFRAINEGRVLDEYRRHGYEIVTVPSPFTNVSLYTADRFIDSGHVKAFELSLARAGNLRYVVPDLQRAVFSSSIRSGVEAAFENTATLARERGGPPKLVLTHVMSPHPPVVFGSKGEPLEAWNCFPVTCTMWDGGQRYGEDTLRMTAGQISHLNTLVVNTVKQVTAASERSPVIVIFSDHGSRHDWGDSQEMLRPLLLTATPGHPGLIPNDASPINIPARILNTYADAGLPLATEESYLVDMDALLVTGPLGSGLARVDAEALEVHP